MAITPHHDQAPICLPCHQHDHTKQPSHPKTHTHCHGQCHHHAPHPHNSGKKLSQEQIHSSEKIIHKAKKITLSRLDDLRSQPQTRQTATVLERLTLRVKELENWQHLSKKGTIEVQGFKGWSKLLPEKHQLSRHGHSEFDSILVTDGTQALEYPLTSSRH